MLAYIRMRLPNTSCRVVLRSRRYQAIRPNAGLYCRPVEIGRFRIHCTKALSLMGSDHSAHGSVPIWRYSEIPRLRNVLNPGY